MVNPWPSPQRKRRGHAWDKSCKKAVIPNRAEPPYRLSDSIAMHRSRNSYSNPPSNSDSDIMSCIQGDPMPQTAKGHIHNSKRLMDQRVNQTNQFELSRVTTPNQRNSTLAILYEIRKAVSEQTLQSFLTEDKIPPQGRKITHQGRDEVIVKKEEWGGGVEWTEFTRRRPTNRIKFYFQ